MPRILMVLDQRFPPDPRVENEAVALKDAGHEVGILAISPDERPRLDDFRECRIFRDRVSQQIVNKMRGLSGTIPILTYYAAYRISRIHRLFPFDILHVHDLYLFGAGLRVQKKLGVPVVGDLHENWVEALRSYAWSTTFPGRLFVDYRRWRRLEARWTTAVDALVVVVEEAALRNVENGVDPNRITVVSNTLNIRDFQANPVDDEIVRDFSGPINVTYVGGFDLHRGLDLVIRAMPRIARELPGSKLVLVGDGRITDDLKALSTSLGLMNDVVYTGWQPASKLRSYITAADICLVPHRRTIHTDATVPHKLFQYMYCEKPVVVSDCVPLKRIVDETGAGLVFSNGDPGSLADTVIELGMNPEQRKAMGLRGRDAVEARYNWDTEAEKLVDMYAGLLARNRG